MSDEHPRMYIMYSSISPVRCDAQFLACEIVNHGVRFSTRYVIAGEDEIEFGQILFPQQIIQHEQARILRRCRADGHLSPLKGVNKHMSEVHNMVMWSCGNGDGVPTNTKMLRT